jgi:uncharacterized protein (DUF1778 family)
MATAAKQTRLNTRISSEAKQTIQRAATLLGTSVSGFVNQVATERAQEVIEKEKVLTLTNQDRDIFLELLEEDTPNENLRAAARSRRELLND